MYSDEEAYEVMRQLVADKKYREAYNFCTTFRCKGNALKASLGCAKDILGFIMSNSSMETSFHRLDFVNSDLDTNFQKIMSNVKRRALIHQMNELKSMFNVQ